MRLYIPLLLAGLFFLANNADAGTAKSSAPNHPKPAGKTTPTIIDNYTLPVSGTLSKSDLTHFGLKILSFKPKDEFDSPPNPGTIAGREFEIDLDASHTYDTSKQVLQFLTFADDYSSDFVLSDWHSISGFGIWSHQIPVRTYEATNGFGAKATVSETHTDKISVAHFSKSYSFQGGGGLPASGGDSTFLKEYSYSISMPPDEARKTARTAMLVVKGTIDALPDGRSVVCGDHHITPKIDLPIEDSGKNCVIVANITSIAFVDRSSGQILKEWH